MLYNILSNNNVLEKFNLLKNMLKNDFLFLHSNYNNDNFINILYKIDTFIKIINNSKKDVIFLNGFFINPKKISLEQYNIINNIIKKKLKKKIKYVYLKREPYESFLIHMKSIKAECCICLEENNNIIINCSRCNEGKICYICYVKYNNNECCICKKFINIYDIKKKELELYDNYYNYNIFLQDKRNVSII